MTNPALKFIDSHVNLHGEKFEPDLDAVIARARAANVGEMLNICCKVSDFPDVLVVAERYDDMWASIGTHPHDAKENPDLSVEDLLTPAAHPLVVGIGETGLDFHYNFSDRDAQLKNFQVHIEAARQSQLPLIIHSRNADEDMIEILKREMAKGAFPALLHCYTSGAELARIAADIGLYFSVSGILTFKNAHDVREIAKDIMPDDRILIETDCPYLAPVPHRGQRNEPAFVPHVAQALADVKGWSLEETAGKTSDAFYALFSKARQ